MKKAISLVLVVVVMLACIGIIACRGSSPTSAPTPTPAPSPSPSASGFTWNDMPVYAGAQPAQKGSWAIPPAEGEWLQAEWRYYEIDSANDVGMLSMFYKMEMPKNGWQETVWVETPEASWGFYNKNTEQDAAMVWVAAEEGKTIFALMRASK